MATVAQSQIQDDVHPLLRHPRPIKRDSAVAHRMLGFIADNEEALKGLHRERSVTTRWLERPMYQHEAAPTVEEEKVQPREEPIPDAVKEEVKEDPKEQPSQQPTVQSLQIPQEKPEDDCDSDLLDKWTNPDRPTSSFNPEATLTKLPDPEPTTHLDTDVIKRRPQPLTRPASYNAQHLLSPEWVASPATLSPQTPRQRPASSHLDSLDKPRTSISSRGSCECDRPHPAIWNYQPSQEVRNVRAERPVSYQPQSFTSLDSPPLQQRPRPTSFATYHTRVRSGAKIASSRGLRNNSYPANSPRQVSGSNSKAISGENIENDMVYQRFGDEEVGPPTPMRSIVSTSIPTFSPPPPPAFSAAPPTPVHNPFDAFDVPEEKTKPEKKTKNRWSTIPQAFKNFGARRRDSAAASQERPKLGSVVDDVRRMNLTEENLHTYETESNRASTTPKRLSAIDLIPTPTYSPFDMNVAANKSSPRLEAPLPAPFAPWTADAPPSPAASADRRRSSGTSLSPRQTPSGLLGEKSMQQQQQVRPLSMMSSPRNSIIAVPSPNITCTPPQPYPYQQQSPHHYQYQSQPSSRPTTADFPRAGTPSRRNTPAMERTCILCKTAKPNWEFVNRRITGNCWHEPATCGACLQTWIRQCVASRGWDACTCPECGEGMGREDVAAFAEVSPL
ncbi:hypothetical protein TW65_01541 [Stemphylium lycopersici]|nr:hypothetical protein TW65_01541 [Stemphylium lycopersici]